MRKPDDLGVEHYLFDFDGTLVDSMPTWADTMLTTIQSYNVPYPDNIIQIITPYGLVKTCEYFISLGANKDVDGILADINARMTPRYRNEIPAKTGAYEKLTGLKNSGKHLHVLTASPHRWLDPCLKRNGIYDIFDNVWSSEDFNMVKTDPGIYRAVADKIGTDIGNIAFFDDNINACRAAKGSGIVTVGVYDKTSENDREIFYSFCDSYIDNFSEL